MQRKVLRDSAKGKYQFHLAYNKTEVTRGFIKDVGLNFNKFSRCTWRMQSATDVGCKSVLE